MLENESAEGLGLADSVLSVHGGSIEDDCTDLVAKGENSIFKVYACSLKLRRYADLIFLNLRTPDCVLRNLRTVPSLRDASNMAVCDESEVCVTQREHTQTCPGCPLNMSKHIQIIKSSVRRPRPLVRSIRTASETAFGQNALSDALGDHPEVCVT